MWLLELLKLWSLIFYYYYEDMVRSRFTLQWADKHSSKIWKNWKETSLLFYFCYFLVRIILIMFFFFFEPSPYWTCQLLCYLIFYDKNGFKLAMRFFVNGIFLCKSGADCLDFALITKFCNIFTVTLKNIQTLFLLYLLYLDILEWNI